MDFIIITNNPRVQREYGDKYCIAYQECSFDEILYTVRDKVHKGHKLLTHPLSGSVKPNETPYKSIMISVDRGPMDNDSLMMMRMPSWLRRAASSTNTANARRSWHPAIWPTSRWSTSS